MFKVHCIVLFVALFASCRWNAGQQAVYDAFDDMSLALSERRYDDLYNGLSASTKELLDLAAAAFTETGMPIEGRGDLLLAEIAAVHPLFEPDRNVADISINGDRAILVPAQGDDGTEIVFIFEEGCWRMDLTPAITFILTEALAGSGATLEQFLHPGAGPQPSTPFSEGGCRLVVTNTLPDSDVYYLFVSPSVSEDWGPDVLGNNVLLPESSCTLYVYPDTYDIMAKDALDNTYTEWGVSISEGGYGWDINRSDLVQQ